MPNLAAGDIRMIEQIHSAWMETEVAGDHESLLNCCAPEIELHPPARPALRGRDAVLAYLAGGTARIHSIDISHRQLHGSNGSATLTAAFNTTFSLPPNPVLKQATGTHTWDLRKHDRRWRIVRISWTDAPPFISERSRKAP